MLDRSQTTNLFSDNALEADELASAADAAVGTAASPETDTAETQPDEVSPDITALPRSRTRRLRLTGGTRRGAVRATPLIAAPRLDSFPPMRGWARHAWKFVPVLLLVLLIVDQPGSTRSAPRAMRALAPVPSTPAAVPHHDTRGAYGHERTRTARASRRPQPQPATPAPASIPAHTPAPAAATAAETETASTAVAAQPTAPTTREGLGPTSPPAGPNSSGPPHEERGKGDEFGFER